MASGTCLGEAKQVSTIKAFSEPRRFGTLSFQSTEITSLTNQGTFPTLKWSQL